jgi:hypothetical protein
MRSRGGTWVTSARTAQDSTASIRPPVDPGAPDETQPPSNLGKPGGKQRRHFSGRARILAGSAGMLILLIVVILIVVANSGSTPPLANSLLPARATIFQDNFSSQANGWDGALQEVSAQYSNGVYRVYKTAKPDNATAVLSSPTKANSVYPSSPPNIRVEVDARFVPGSAHTDNLGYFVACRADPDNWYAFTIWGTYISIDKYFSYSPYYKQLKTTDNSAAHLNGYNLLQAQCASVEGGQSVHLVFAVNGRVVVTATDTDKPLPANSVGLGVSNVDATKPVEAEFDNFVVRQV